MLAQSIQNVYTIFSTYHLSARIHGCYCNVCLNEEYNTYLHKIPLKQLTSQDLSAYLYSCEIVSGNKNDFKYFLPRILELYTQRPIEFDSGFYDKVDDVIGQSNWQDWEKEEAGSMNNFFKEVWKKSFENGDISEISNKLFDLSLSGFDIDYCLQQIEKKGDDFVTELLIEILDRIEGKLDKFRAWSFMPIQEERQKLKDWFLLEKNQQLLILYFKTGKDEYGRTTFTLE